MTINNTWAYNIHDREFKSAKFLIRALVEVASRGGNFLLNVGPQPDGAVQPEFQERLRAIGEWLSMNGDSIYGTTYGPVQGIASLRTTAKANSVFVHVFDWPAGPLEITGLNAHVMRAHMLSTGQTLTFRQDASKLQIDVAAQAPDPNVSTIVLNTL